MKNREFKVKCPDCVRNVDRVDGEYARHTARGQLCVMSKREIVETREEKKGP